MSKAKMIDKNQDYEWTQEDFTNGVHFSEGVSFAEAAKTAHAIYKKRGKQLAPKKVHTSIRLSQSVIDYFKSTGSGWQARIDIALQEMVAEKEKTAQK